MGSNPSKTNTDNDNLVDLSKVDATTMEKKGWIKKGSCPVCETKENTCDYSQYKKISDYNALQKQYDEAKVLADKYEKLKPNSDKLLTEVKAVKKNVLNYNNEAVVLNTFRVLLADAKALISVVTAEDKNKLSTAQVALEKVVDHIENNEVCETYAKKGGDYAGVFNKFNSLGKIENDTTTEKKRDDVLQIIDLINPTIDERLKMVNKNITDSLAESDIEKEMNKTESFTVTSEGIRSLLSLIAFVLMIVAVGLFIYKSNVTTDPFGLNDYIKH